jgi:hypothetical protein
MSKWIRIELIIDNRITDFAEIRISPKTTIASLLKRLKRFLEETAE